MLPVYRTSPILRQPSSKVWCTNLLWGGPWLTCIVFQLGQNLRLGCSGQGQPQGPLAQGCGSQRQQHRPQRSRDSVQLEHWPGLMSEEVFQGQVTDPGPSTVAGNLLFVSYCTGTSWNETVLCLTVKCDLARLTLCVVWRTNPSFHEKLIVETRSSVPLQMNLI